MSNATAASTQPPLLSILCLTYNHEAFVAQTLEGFLAQQVGFEIEVIVADDCSTDGTVAVVERFSARFGERLRLLRAPVNLGVTRNFRRALAACRGRYVALCEGDDFWNGSSKLQQQVDFLEANAAFVMCFHDATIIDTEGRSHGTQLPPRLQRDATAAQLMATRPISTLTVCFRNLLSELPPELDQAPALDLCLWSLLGQHGAGKYLRGIEPASYRVHGGGVFSTQTERTRYIMTAQSLLCLARIHGRQGKAALSNRILLKAAVMASARLGAGACLLLVGAVFARLVARPLRRAWLRVAGG